MIFIAPDKLIIFSSEFLEMIFGNKLKITP